MPLVPEVPGPALDLADDTFVAAGPARVRTAVEDPALWRRWWPEQELRVRRDRGLEGFRWDVSGALAGTAELWLEPVLDGTVVHYYLRADPGPMPRHRVDRLRREHAVRWKRHAWALKDALEAGRRPGEPAA